MQETQETIPTTTQAGVVNEQSLSSEDLILQREKLAFATYVKNQGGAIPENFKDIDAWFHSLKNAQGEYTKSRQELSSMKQKYEPTIISTPVPPVEPITMSGFQTAPNLKIPTQSTNSIASATQADWKSWTLEYTQSNGLSNETIESIKSKTNMTEDIINEYMSGQKAKVQIAYSKASDIVGGKDKMDNIFKWASKNLPQNEQDSINASLATSNWEITLLGLTSKYDKATSSHTSQEPSNVAINQRVQFQQQQNPHKPYTSRREFNVERSNPRFMSEPAFRQAVEARMILTDFNNITA